MGYILFLLFIPNIQTNKFHSVSWVAPMPERIIQISKITSNRQVTVPVEIMKKLKVEVGDKIIWMERDGDIIVKKA